MRSNNRYLFHGSNVKFATLKADSYLTDCFDMAVCFALDKVGKIPDLGISVFVYQFNLDFNYFYGIEKELGEADERYMSRSEVSPAKIHVVSVWLNERGGCSWSNPFDHPQLTENLAELTPANIAFDS